MAKKKSQIIYSSSSYKTLQCNKCGEDVKRVGIEAVMVTCWKCAMQTLKKI